MIFGDDDLQAVLAAWPKSATLPDKAQDSLLDRICQVLAAALVETTSSRLHADLQPLLRHYLLRNSAIAGHPQHLKVPALWGWPSRDSWAQHGIEAIHSGDNSFLISALPWHSEWLGAGEDGMFADAFTDKLVRQQTRCEADPFIQNATGCVFRRM